MLEPTTNTYLFRLGRSSHIRISLLSWGLLASFLLCALISAILGIQLWPTYAHTFTPYLKWQDALVTLFWFITFISLGGCILVWRFLHALRLGYKQEMLTLVGDTELRVRDLSPKNLASIFWMVSTAFSCFIATLVGLIPEMLIGWTLKLPELPLAVIGTSLAILLSLAGLIISLPAFSFVIIGVVGSVSFTRKMAASQTYLLTRQARLMIDGFELTIIYPDQPESMIDLKLLSTEDQRQLLALLHKCWIEADQPWNPVLGEEIRLALEEAERNAILVV